MSTLNSSSSATTDFVIRAIRLVGVGMLIVVGVMGYRVFRQPPATSGNPFIPIGVVGMVAVDCLIVAEVLSYVAKRKAERQKLVYTGEIVQAKYVRARVSPGSANSTFTSYIAEAEWTNETTGVTYYFSSESTKEDLFTKWHEGQLVPVYINPADPRQYYFEVSPQVMEK